MKDQRLKRALVLALGYLFLIYASLYFTPFLGAYLQNHALLENFMDGFHILFGVGVAALFFLKYRIISWKAYLLFGLVLILFLLAFLNARHLTERFHYVEYAIVYALWFRVFRHFYSGVLCYGVTLGFGSFIGLIDEVLQKFLPNRHFDWQDIGMNVTGLLFGVASVFILMHFRRDKKRAASLLSSKGILLICLGLVLPNLSFGSPNASLLEEAHLYRAIDQLVGLRLIRKIIVGHKPYSKNEIARLIQEAKENIGILKDIEEEIHVRKILKDLSEKFPLKEKSEISFHPFSRMELEYLFLDSPARAIPANTGTGDRIEGVVNPLVSYLKGRRFEDTHNFSTAANHFVDLTKYVSIAGRSHFLFRQNENLPDNMQWGFDELYLRSEFKNIGVQIGRDVLALGPSHEGGVFHSTNATPLDMFKISNVHPFYYPWIFKVLGPSQISFYFSVLEPNRDRAHAYISGMKFSFLPHPNFEIGFTNAVMSGGEGSQRASVGKRVADAFGFIGALVGQDPNISNRIGGFDFSLRFPSLRGLKLYYEWMTEDTKSPNHFDLMFIDEAIHLVGFYLPRLNRTGTKSIRLEFQHSGFRPYRHHQYSSGWTHNRRILGSELGPDAIGFFVELETQPTSHFHQRHRFSFEERDSDQFHLFNDATEVRRTADNPAERRIRWLSSLDWQVASNLTWSFSAGFERAHQFNFTPGLNVNNFLVGLKLTFHPEI